MTLTPPPPLPSRRSALAVLLAAPVTAACSSGRDAVERPGSPAPDPDLELLRDARTSEEAMLDLLERTIARHPGLQKHLAGALVAHTAHVATLAGHDASGSSTESTTPSPTPTPVPPQATKAVAVVTRAETALSHAQARHAAVAASGPFAALLASLAASAAQQAYLLRSPARGETA